MRNYYSIFLVVYLVLITKSVFADGLLFRLPADGEYVVFNLESEYSTSGRHYKHKGTLKISSVGIVAKNKNKSRWIEIKVSAKTKEGLSQLSIGKFLIAEEKLGEGKHAFDNKIRGWERLLEDADLKKIKDVSEGFWAVFLCGPLKNQKQLPAALVKTKIGELECKGVKGYSKFNIGGRLTKVVFETRLHDKAPFGVVSTTLIYQTERASLKLNGKITLTLQEIGHNAKSELPDAK